MYYPWHLYHQLEVEVAPLGDVMDVVAVDPDPGLVLGVPQVVGHRVSHLGMAMYTVHCTLDEGWYDQILQTVQI
jgi:hypothetical protein